MGSERDAGICSRMAVATAEQSQTTWFVVSITKFKQCQLTRSVFSFSALMLMSARMTCNNCTAQTIVEKKINNHQVVKH